MSGSGQKNRILFQRNQKAEPNGSVSGGGLPKITPAEAEVLGYLRAGLSTARTAAKKRCSRSYVRRVKRKLEDLGLFSPNSFPAEPKGGYTPEPPEPKRISFPKEKKALLKRVHAQRFEFDIVSVGSRFREGIGQHIDDEGTWVQVHGRRLFVYAAKERVFHGTDTQEALSASYRWWVRKFRQVEKDLDVVFLKPRRAFTVLYQEIATEDAEDARSVVQAAGSMVRLYHHEDGKLRVSFDKSRGYERETHHRRDGVRDDAALDRHFAGILDHPEVLTLVEASAFLRELHGAVLANAHSIGALVASHKSLSAALGVSAAPPVGDASPGVPEYVG